MSCWNACLFCLSFSWKEAAGLLAGQGTLWREQLSCLSWAVSAACWWGLHLAPPEIATKDFCRGLLKMQWVWGMQDSNVMKNCKPVCCLFSVLGTQGRLNPVHRFAKLKWFVCWNDLPVLGLAFSLSCTKQNLWSGWWRGVFLPVCVLFKLAWHSSNKTAHYLQLHFLEPMALGIFLWNRQVGCDAFIYLSLLNTGLLSSYFPQWLLSLEYLSSCRFLFFFLSQRHKDVSKSLQVYRCYWFTNVNVIYWEQGVLSYPHCLLWVEGTGW